MPTDVDSQFAPLAHPHCCIQLVFLVCPAWACSILKKVLFGAGECQKIDWSFLGLSMPGWVLVMVVALTVVGLWNQFRTR